MKKMLCFDMDGTIADLYGVDNWLEKIKKNDPLPYAIANPMWDMVELREVVQELIAKDWEIRIITWLAKNAKKEYKNKVRKVKLDWLNQYGFPYQVCHIVQYGTPKTNCVRNKADYIVLVDDDEVNRKKWTLGDTIDPTAVNLIKVLRELQ